MGHLGSVGGITTCRSYTIRRNRVERPPPQGHVVEPHDPRGRTEAVRPTWPVALLVASLATQRPTLAADVATSAQQAFDEGRRLEDAGDFAAATARFEESERLEPALGTILNLATCYERGGRVASAWRAFRRGADEAMALGEEKRARRAIDRADALVARLSTVALRTEGDAAAGEEIRLDGALVAKEAWDTPQPVDGGKHSVGARASGRVNWSTTFVVASEGEHASVEVPALVVAPPEVDATPAIQEPAQLTHLAPAPEPRPATSAGGKTWTPVRLTGAVSAGLGLIAVGFGVGYGIEASARWSERQANCAYNYCNTEGYALTGQARDAANASTVAFTIGGGGLAAGALLFLFAPRAGKDVSVSGEALPGGGIVRVRGAF